MSKIILFFALIVAGILAIFNLSSPGVSIGDYLQTSAIILILGYLVVREIG